MTNPAFSSKIVYMRDKHMIIQKKRKPSLSNRAFSAVFVTDDNYISNMLRNMESPEHNEWNNDFVKMHLSVEEIPIEYKNLKVAIDDFIKTSIKTTNVETVEEELEIPTMEDHIPTGTTIGEDGEKVETYKERDVEEIEEEKNEEAKPKNDKTGVGIKETTGTPGVGGKGIKKRQSKKRIKKKRKPMVPGAGTPILYPVELKWRSFAVKKVGKYEHVIMLHCSQDAKCKVTLFVAGDGDDEKPIIGKAINRDSGLPYTIIDNTISGVQVKSGNPLPIVAELDDCSEKYRLKIEAYEDK